MLYRSVEMTEITRMNFREFYPKIIDDLQSSDFTAIDCEFSGLMPERHSLFDTGTERYDKLRKGLENYTIIQIGITTFNYHNTKTSQFSSKSYCFHLMPSPCFQANVQLSFETHSVHFLCKHKFDFNKIFYQGINYLNERDEGKVEKMINEETIPLERDLLDYIDSVIGQVAEWRVDAKVGDKTEIVIDDCQENFVTHLIVLEIRRNFRDLWSTSDKTKIVTVKKVTQSERYEISNGDDEHIKVKKMLLESALGFTIIMKELKRSKKPIVGHNLLLDLMMIYKQFYNTLPKSYKKFKSEITRIFPEVYDTKYLSYQLKNLLPLSNAWSFNSLPELYKYFKNGKGTLITMYMPQVEHHKPDFTDDDKFHQSGFDSFCTGFIFVKMSYMFSIWDAGKKSFIATGLPMNRFWLFSGITMMRNRINIPLSSIKYVELDGSDPASNPKVFLYIENVLGRPIDRSRICNEIAKHTIADFKQLRKYSGMIAVSSQVQGDKLIELYKSSSEYRVCRYNAFKHSNWSKMIGIGSLLASLLLAFVSFQQKYPLWS